LAGALGATSAPTLRIIPDERTNALFVSGTDEEIEQIESFLELIDSNELPPLLTERVPRTIPVLYANVHNVADTIRELYKDYLTDPAARQRNDDRREGDRSDDRRESRDRDRDAQSRSGGRSSSGRSLGVRLTLAVDEQASQLIVSCNEPLFRQISTLVEERDEAARESQPSVEMIRLPSAGPAQAAAVLQTLQALSPKVSVTEIPDPRSAAPATSSRSTSSRSTSSASQRYDRYDRGGSNRSR
jgi:Ni/Co efflux regulator RcnB